MQWNQYFVLADLCASTNIGVPPCLIKLWISNYVYVTQWDVIFHPCQNFNGDLVKSNIKPWNIAGSSELYRLVKENLVSVFIAGHRRNQ